MQIVYISNRPETLLETLGHVTLFMPFVDSAVACVPAPLVTQLAALQASLPLQLISENEILSSHELAGLDRLDHQRRNYLLRSRLVSHPAIEAQFIMSDDDARPLKTIDLSCYLQADRHHRFYFHDLTTWLNNQTEFDAGQLSTGAVLAFHNMPTLAYASHMPQIVDKELFLESAGYFATIAKEQSLCEWSSYFNYAGSKYPEKFHPPKTYVTLCWPEHPLAWKPRPQPAEFLFENFTPACYAAKAVFGEFESAATDLVITGNANIEKIVRWRKYEIACRHPEQGTGWRKYLNWRTWINKLFRHVRD